MVVLMAALGGEGADPTADGVRSATARLASQFPS